MRDLPIQPRAGTLTVVPTGDPKHRARRFNEGLKLAATLANSLSIATFGAAFVIPIAQRDLDVLSDGG